MRVRASEIASCVWSDVLVAEIIREATTTTDLLHMCVLAQACACCGRVSVHFPLPAASNGARTRDANVSHTHARSTINCQVTAERGETDDSEPLTSVDSYQHASLFEVVVVLIQLKNRIENK